MSDLREQINSLSPAEKAELLDAVWESLEADAVSLTNAQRAELDYRISRHEKAGTLIAGASPRTFMNSECRTK
jgi:putative addiction module component (TIGR02574 family)